MGEKYLKKIVNLTVIREEWQNNTISGEDFISFTVQGEIKNTGLSVVKNAVIIAAIVNNNSGKTYQVFNKKLAIFKAADYTILPPIKSGDIVPFEININFPPFKSLLFGRWGLQSLEDKILNEDYKQRVFLVYDTNILDEKTQEWFRDELLENIKLVYPKWEPIHNTYKVLTEFKCSGQIKNIGTREIKKFYVHGILEDKYGETLKLENEDKEYNIHGNQMFEALAPNTRDDFEFSCRLPSIEILEENKLSPSLIEKRVANGEYKTRIFVQYVDDMPRKFTYRDTDEAPTVIEEEVGEKKIENIDEDWSLEDDEYYVTGTIKNSGTRDVENIYVIASILDKNNAKPIVWETATDTLKTLMIEKVPYLKVDEELPYAFRIKIPSGKLFSKTKWSSKNIPEGIDQGDLRRNIALYYTKEDVREEGIKRLRFGNSYFQLKNFRGCLREYNEGIKLIPDEKRFYLNIALCYYKIGELQRAIENCKNALKTDDTYSKAMYLLGLICHTMKKYDEALSWYQKALNVDKANPKIIYNISCLNFTRNNVEDGIKMLRQAFTFDKNLVLSQMVRDPELRPVKNTVQFADFLKEIREEAVHSH